MKAKKIVPIILTFTAAVLSVTAFTACAGITGNTAKTTVNAIVKDQLQSMRKAAANATRQTAEIKQTAVKTTVNKAQPVTEAPKKETKPVTEASKKEAKSASAAPKKEAKPQRMAAPSQTDADRVMEAARKAVEKCTDSSMSKEQKLKAAFEYLQKNYLEGSRRALYTGADWAVVYAKDLLIGGKGDCFSYGAAFAYMAKAIGFEEAYACNSGGHGWAEIDGKIYDPEWSMHSSKYSYYGMSYDEPCDVAYKGAVGWADWTHVKV